MTVEKHCCFDLLLRIEHLILLCRHSFTDDHYVEFSKHSQDRVIGTKGDIAHVSITFKISEANLIFSV